MKLKFKEKTVRIVSYGDWDSFVNYHLGRLGYPTGYEMVPYEELQNDMIKEYNFGKYTECQYDEKSLKEGDFSFKTQYIGEKFVSLGLLDPGTYLIDVY